MDVYVLMNDDGYPLGVYDSFAAATEDFPGTWTSAMSEVLTSRWHEVVVWEREGDWYRIEKFTVQTLTDVAGVRRE